MFKKGGVSVLVLMLLGSCLAGTASAAGREVAGGPGSPFSRGSTSAPAASSISSVQKVFDLRGLPADKRDIVRQTLQSHDFDWNLLLPALRSGDHRKRIPITVTDASEWDAVGLAWPAPVGKVEVDDDVLDPLWFRDVVLHEVGHMVDFFYLEPYGLRGNVAEIYGVPWDDMGHSFNAAFTQAFSTTVAVDGLYPLSDSQILELRSVLGASGAAPAKSDSLSRVRDFDPDFSISIPAVHDHSEAASPAVPVA